MFIPKYIIKDTESEPLEKLFIKIDVDSLCVSLKRGSFNDIMEFSGKWLELE